MQQPPEFYNEPQTLWSAVKIKTCYDDRNDKQGNRMDLLRYRPQSFDGSARALQSLSRTPDAIWHRRSEQLALQLFHKMAQKVPAYKDFLHKKGIDSSKVRSVKDLCSVPYITKANYLRQYPLSQLSWDGEASQASMINRSSGSTGKPFYWLNNEQQRRDVGDFYDIVFSSIFNMRRRRTLVIVAYGMGSWVAGTTTLLSSINYMNKYNCTFITPGVRKQEIVEICRDIGHEYEQVVLCGYPPLIKEIIDYGEEEGLDWRPFHIKVIFGAEAFSEDFRNYILKKIGSMNPLFDTVNTIGSADAMVLGHETPLSIGLRRLICDDDELRDDLLGSSRMPTFAQYYPWQKYFEVEEDRLLVTSNGAIPLIRYDIQDKAKIFSYSELSESMMEHGYKDMATVLPENVRHQYNWRLPFILMYGKSTNAIKFYGAIVYPENIKAALEKTENARSFTGKFLMQRYSDARQNQRLRVTIELSPGIASTAINNKELQAVIVETLCNLNSEFRSSYADIGKRMWPTLKLVPYGTFNMTEIQNKHSYK